MTLKEAHEIAVIFRESAKCGLHLKSVDEAMLILDDRVGELEAQRDIPRKTLRILLDILENINIEELRVELAKYNKDLPRFEDIIGLFADKTEGEA